MPVEEQALDQAAEYIDRAVRNRSNFDRMVEEGALDKASEVLWGLFLDYTNALAIIRLGRPFSKHGPTVEFARSIAKETHDERLRGAISVAEEMHANFYHGFLSDPGALRKPFEEITYYATVLDDMARREGGAGLSKRHRVGGRFTRRERTPR